MEIQFHGADQNVTGSCHFLEVGNKRLLIDCGLYQGGREIDEENAGPFGFEPEDIDYLLLTHADLGLSGRAIIRDPDTPPKVDVVVMETTYRCSDK